MNIFEVIKKPRLTEKGMGLQEAHNQIVLRVDPRANKHEIKQAVEGLFNVKVEGVRTANMPGKEKRLGRNVGQTSDWKKAIVTLAEGSKVDFLSEL
ncbi:MAG: 50S ribosomal protein L23 [Thermodesulfobacteriota bacterium]